MLILNNIYCFVNSFLWWVSLFSQKICQQHMVIWNKSAFSTSSVSFVSAMLGRNLFWIVWAESIEWFIEDKAISASYDLAPPPPPQPSPVNMLLRWHTGRLIRETIFWEKPNHATARKPGPSYKSFNTPWIWGSTKPVKIPLCQRKRTDSFKRTTVTGKTILKDRTFLYFLKTRLNTRISTRHLFTLFLFILAWSAFPHVWKQKNLKSKSLAGDPDSGRRNAVTFRLSRNYRFKNRLLALYFALYLGNLESVTRHGGVVYQTRPLGGGGGGGRENQKEAVF